MDWTVDSGVDSAVDSGFGLFVDVEVAEAVLEGLDEDDWKEPEAEGEMYY